MATSPTPQRPAIKTPTTLTSHTKAVDEHTLLAVFDCPVINEANTQSFLQVISGSITPDIDHLYLLLNTPGGSVNLGILLYNYLRSLPVTVTTHNIGQVDSIGNVIFVAGENRFATPNSTFLFHGVLSGQWMGLSVPKAKEAISQLENDENRMTTILREHTGFLARELKAFYREGKSITPEKALEKGVIHRVAPIAVDSRVRRVVVPTMSPNH